MVLGKNSLARPTLALLLFVVFGFGVSACRRPPAATVVRIGTMGEAVDYAPFMVARAKGWFDEAYKAVEPTTVEYTTFQSLPALNESLATNRLDVVFEAEPPAIIGKAAGNDLRIVGISCSLNQEIVVQASSSIAAVADLRGKSVAVPAGTSSHYNLLAILAAGGVSDSDVTLLDMTPPDGRAAFEAGRVDAWAIWPPWIEQLVLSGKGRVIPDTNARIHSILSVRGKFQDEHAALVQASVDVLERTKAWIRANPQEAQQIVARGLKLDAKVIELAWPKHEWTAQLTPAITTDIQAKADFLVKRGLIKSPVDVARHLIFPLAPKN